MATYTVIQYIESEDKLIGPLTLRQFIYACVGAVCLYLSFLVLTKHAGFLAIFFLPVALTAIFFAFPWKLNQPPEVWALAKIRFLFKPRRRIWDQSGIQELVEITAPKKSQDYVGEKLSQTEVKSRLASLADLIDTRGWAIKNVGVDLSEQTNSDRLIDITTLPVNVPSVDIQAADDVLDEVNNPIAKHFNEMITASTKAHRQYIRQELLGKSDAKSLSGNKTPRHDYWFLDKPSTANQPLGNAVFTQPEIVRPGSADDQLETVEKTNDDAEEEGITEKLKMQQSESDLANSNLHRLSQYTPALPQVAPPPSMTPVTDPAILGFATRNDLNISTLARQVNHQSDEGSDEVIVKLH